MKTFFDSSAFAKRFLDEEGSDRVEEACQQASELGLSVLCVPEIVSALNRRRREKTLNMRQYDEAKRRVIEDVRDVELLNLTLPVIGAAIRILESSPVRAMDALYIACAVEWGAELFITSDQRQLLAARRSGLEAVEV